MILVSGAAGLSGTAIVREFARKGTKVRALVRDREKGYKLADFPNVEVVEGDMLEPDTLGPALRDVDRALVLSSANMQMVETQCRFIDACKTAGVRHVVKFSGAESLVGFNPRNFRFGAMHEDIEDYLEASGLAWTHVRPSQFMQVYLREVKSITKGGMLRLPLEDIQMSPVDVEDIAKVVYALLTSGGHEGESFEMTGPQALTMHQVAEVIGDAIGKHIRYVPITPEERQQDLVAAGFPSTFIDAVGEQTAERLRHPVARVDLRTHAIFAVRPTSFEEFVNRNAAAFSTIDSPR